MANIQPFGNAADYWSQFQPAGPAAGLAVQPNTVSPQPVSTTAPGGVDVNALNAQVRNTALQGAASASGQPPAGGFTSVPQFVDYLATKYPKIGSAKQYYIDQITSHLDPSEAASLAKGGTLSAGTVGYWSDPNSLHVDGGGGGGSTAPGSVGGFSGTPFTPPTGVDEQNDPGFQFALQQGEQGLLRNNAATGTLRTAKTLKDLASFDIGTAQQDYGNVFNRALNTFSANSGQKLAYDQLNSNNLLGLSSQGLSAADAGATAGAGYAGANSNLVTGQGNANAAGSIAQGNNWSSLISSLDPTSLSELKKALGLAA